MRRRRARPGTTDDDPLFCHVEGDRVDFSRPLTRRAFVIGPLLDLLPDCRLPDGTPVADYWPAVAAQPLQRLHCLEENHFADRTH